VPRCHDEKACATAAQAGDLEALRWLRVQSPPCPWSAQACALAARGGHLAALQWMRAQEPPCPWDISTWELAVRGVRLEVLDWAKSTCPGYARTSARQFLLQCGSR
jgi:hypothetical protein